MHLSEVSLEGMALVLAVSLFVARALAYSVPWLVYEMFLLVLLLESFLQGPHWQLGPIYMVALLVPLIVRGTGRIRLVIAGTLTLFLTSSTVILCYLLPMFRLPQPTGPYPVATRILHMVDHSRPDSGGSMASGRRELMVQAWYPIDKTQANGRLAPYRRSAETTLLSSYMAVLKTQSYSDNSLSQNEKSYPVILFNPAWKGQRTQSTYLMQELASHGFVVVSVDHTYLSGPVAFPDGTVTRSADVQDIDDFEGRTLTAQQQQGENEVMLEAADDSFVLDELTRRQMDGIDPWYEGLRLSRVGAAGHSFGGAVAYQVAFSDSRIASSLNMDGWTFGDPTRHGFRTVTMQMYEDVSIPSDTDLQANSNSSRLYWNLTKHLERVVTSSLRCSGGYQLIIKGSRHMNFSDRSLYSPIRKWTDSGRISPGQAHKIVSAYALAFFEETLLDKQVPLLISGSLEFPEVIVTRYPPPYPPVSERSECTDHISQIR